MKKIFVLLFGTLMSMILYAQDKNALVIKLNNGAENAYILSEKPTVLIQDDKIIVTGVLETQYLRSEISKFYFEGISLDDHRIIDAIESIAKDNVFFYYVDSENVRISGLKDKATVSVASLDGKIISTPKCDGTGSVTISLGNQPKGIYIISYGGRSLKIKR